MSVKSLRRWSAALLGVVLTTGLWSVPAKAQTASTEPVEKNVYSSTFLQSAGHEWSADRLSSNPSGNRKFLGLFAEEKVTFQLNDLPDHRFLRIRLDLLIIRSWDGSGLEQEDKRPDLFIMRLADGPCLLHTSFSNNEFIPDVGLQAFPWNYPGPAVKGRTGAFASNTLGFTFNHGQAGLKKSDTTYRFDIILPHTSESLKLIFEGRNLTSTADEAWGLDNVRIDVLDSTPQQSLTQQQMEKLWDEMTGLLPEKSLEAMWQFVAAGETGQRFLEKKLNGLLPEDKTFDRLIATLDDQEYRTRKKATEAIGKLGLLAMPVLRQKQYLVDSAETRVRLSEAIDTLGQTASEEPKLARKLWAARALSILKTSRRGEKD
ncbi:MAG: HEAT repeat domain-containing protein [Phycisphaerae bacterium]